MPARGPRPARSAPVAIRFGEVTLRRPASAARNLAEAVTLRGVDVREVDMPEGMDAVHWCLLRTQAVPDVTRARGVVGWHRLRWTVEPVFRTPEGAGTDAEGLQAVEARRFVKLAATGPIAAVRIVQIGVGRDAATAQPLSDVADPADTPMLKSCCAKLEGRTERLKNPYADHTLAWFVCIVARLGGCSGYRSKGYSNPTE